MAAALCAATLGGCGPAILAGSGAVVGRSVLQERSTLAALGDTETELSISTRLGQHSARLFNDVSVDVVERRVVLTGSVPTREDRVAAEAIAWAGPNVRAVTNELTVAEDAGVRAYWRDAGISNALRLALVRDGRVAAWNYNVETVDGVVHLTGLARSREELARAIALARATEGASRVVSHVLVIDDPRRFAPPERTADAARPT